MLFFDEPDHVNKVGNSPLLMTQNGDDTEEKGAVGECQSRNYTRMVFDGGHAFMLWEKTDQSHLRNQAELKAVLFVVGLVCLRLLRRSWFFYLIKLFNFIKTGKEANFLHSKINENINSINSTY